MVAGLIGLKQMILSVRKIVFFVLIGESPREEIAQTLNLSLEALVLQIQMESQTLTMLLAQLVQPYFPLEILLVYLSCF